MGRLAMLAGLFAVPMFLLWAGHQWRHAGPRMRGAFWGGIIAHSLGAVLATVAGVVWPVEWEADDTVRGFLGFWSMLLLSVAGATIGALMNGRAAVPAGDSARSSQRRCSSSSSRGEAVPLPSSGSARASSALPRGCFNPAR